MRWNVLPVPKVADDYEGHFRAVRLNSLGSLYWFTKYTLGKERLRKLHEHLCRSLEAEDLHLVLEVPMGFFKTVEAMALSIWWALPINWQDEARMSELGYKPAWVRYMRAVHNQNTRTLIAHEIDKRAVDIGKEVDFAYWSNDRFRHSFPEILPDKECEWNDHSKYQKRTPEMPIDPTNPTFAYCGVGHALQGVHPDSTIEDDCFGRAAQQSMLKGDGRVRDDTIRWHQQLTTRLDTSQHTKHKLGRQLVLGNRWGHQDLNHWIRENQPHFTFESHDAEGGCCKLHRKHGVPIFPEEWDMPRLKHREQDLGRYDYYHFMRNQTTLPEECIFDKSWLHYFTFKQSRPELNDDDPRNILLLQHQVDNGEVLDDLQPGGLLKVIIVAPNHAKTVKRTKHVIWGAGYDLETSRIYLLSLWAESCTYSELVEELYRTAKRWQLSSVWMGELSAKILEFYLAQRDRREPPKFKISVNTFPEDNSQNAMTNRIEALEPLFRERQVWAHPYQKQFVTELGNYPSSTTDTLDVLGYFTETINVVHGADDFIRKQQEAFSNRGSGAGGY